MKRLTNRQRCRKCAHKCVCTYPSYFDNVDRPGERCIHYSPKKDLKSIKTKVIKEFLNKARERSYESSDWSHGEHSFVVEWDDLVAIYEEMVGEG